MQTFVVVARTRQFIVDAENQFRAIQEVIAVTELYAKDISKCDRLDSYLPHMQKRLLAESIIL
jgi:hypothetical protein